MPTSTLTGLNCQSILRPTKYLCTFLGVKAASEGTERRHDNSWGHTPIRKEAYVTNLPQDPSAIPVPLLDVCRGNAPLKEEIMATLSEIFDSGRFVGGPHCQSLERTVSEVCNTEFAIGCASGSDAILLALMAKDIGPGDEVICPSFTFFATASAIARLGATPVFVDIDPISYNMDPALIESAVTPRTRAIIPVHLFGQCADMDPIMEIASAHDLYVIEDAAQAIGATYKGRPAGSIGDVGCFSFYPTKNLGGCGDGGILSTNDAEIADRLRLLANHGMRPRYYHQELGINSRLDSIQAAILSIKIRHLKTYSGNRQKNADLYTQIFGESGINNEITLPKITHTNSRHVWNQYTIRIPNGWRDNIRQQMTDVNIGTEIYYPIPLHRQECFQSLCYEIGSLPETERASSDVLSLPIFPELTEAEIRYVVSQLVNAMSTQHSQVKMAA